MKPVKTDYKKEADKMAKPDVKEVLENLKVQFEQHEKQEKYHRNMKLKALGAIEVLTQIEGDKE